MEYRVNRRTGDRVSVLGMGTSVLPYTRRSEAVATLAMAYERGVNYFDLATAESGCFSLFGEALAGVRDKVFYQVHFGASYGEGMSYGLSYSLNTVKRSVEWQLRKLKTDYIDYGFVHCLDEAADWDRYVQAGIWEYLLSLKEKGVVRHIGLSTHTPSTAGIVLGTGKIDMLMFSINAGYDCQHGEYARGHADERMRLYRRCEAMGTGITVMKPFSGGQLLDSAFSPFGRAMNSWQCLQYCLDRPGVLTVLPGLRNRQDLENILGFFDAAPEEKDYSVISSLTPADMRGVCVYCNHCKPCPAGLDTGLINKYYDLARAGDTLALDHYTRLSVRASSCTGCGHCDRRCPFKVIQSARMREISAYFGD